MQHNKNKKITVISFASLFAAMTAVFIYLIHIPYGTTGYIHFGDAVIFLCASLVPAPYSVLAAAVGAGLADFLSGFPLYIIPTIAVKALMALTFSSKTKKLISKRNLVACAVSILISLALYGLTEFLFGIYIYSMPPAGAVTVAASTLLQNSIQGAVSIVIYLAAGAALDKFNVKSRFVGLN